MITTYLKLIAKYPYLTTVAHEHALLFAYLLGHHDSTSLQMQIDAARAEINELRHEDVQGHA